MLSIVLSNGPDTTCYSGPGRARARLKIRASYETVVLLVVWPSIPAHSTFSLSIITGIRLLIK